MTFDVHALDLFVLVGSAVTILAILAVRVSSRAGLPSLLIYLAMGVALGEAGVGIEFENAAVAQALGFAALAIILAEGGLTTRLRDFRPAMRIGLSLATIGVAVSVTVMAVGAHYVLGLPWELAFLLGAVTSPTDAAAVFSVLRAAPIKKRLSGALEAESGLNDAPTVVLVTLISSEALGEHGIAVTAGVMVYELVVGVACGVMVGLGGAWLMRRAALPASGLYPIDVLTLTFLAYGAATFVHASGFAAVYVAALVLGNSELPHRGATRVLRKGVASARPDRAVRDARSAALARPDLVGDRRGGPAGRPQPHRARPPDLGGGQLAGRADALARPDLLVVGRTARRGADRADDHPLRQGSPDSPRLFDVVFVMVVIYTLLTGPTLPLVARWLGVDRRHEPRGIELEAAPLNASRPTCSR